MRVRGFTLVEIIIASAAVVLLLVGIVNMFQFTLSRYDRQASNGFVNQEWDTAMGRIKKDARNAMSFSTITSGSNTLYVFTSPNTVDSAGNYEPESVSGAVEYVAGSKVAYYLSNTTGSTSVSNGTVLWRATAPAGSTSASSFTTDTSWSSTNTGVARCPNITAFSITTTGMPTNAVNVTLGLTDTSNHTTSSFSLSRELYMLYNTFGTTGSSTTGSTGGVASSGICDGNGVDEMQFTNTSVITAMTITITVATSNGGASYYGDWNNQSDVNYSYTTTGGNIVYTFTLATGNSLAASTYTFDGEFALTGSHTYTEDTYTMTYTTGGKNYSESGAF